jgi:putative DNA methylase
MLEEPMPHDLPSALAGMTAWSALEPSLIETVFPVSRLSSESFVERDSKGNQTLTATSSYWKGRKPLILVHACVLASLLPATGDDDASRARDMAMFLRLMAMDDASLWRRHTTTMKADEAAPFLSADEKAVHFEDGPKAKWRSSITPEYALRHLPATISDTLVGYVDEQPAWRAVPIEVLRAVVGDAGEEDEDADGGTRRWSPIVAARRALRRQGDALAFGRMSYRQKLDFCLRPEELDEWVDPAAWADINAYYGTSAASTAEFVEQLGIKRFGHRPRVSDRFAGGGSIPFEAARMGCDVEATDLNPIAAMLTWAALNVVGGTDEYRSRLAAAQDRVAKAVDRRLTELKVEHDADGNRAKAFLYCLETRCPTTGWMVPMSTTWVIHKWKNVVIELVENPTLRRFDFRCVMGASDEQMAAAAEGTCRGVDLVYTIDGTPYRRSLKSVRGDIRVGQHTSSSLRQWTIDDVSPRPGDTYQERLMCIRRIRRDDGADLYSAPKDEDLEREERVRDYVQQNLRSWQTNGLVADMEILPGYNTDQPMRERGWKFWHHLFHPRQLMLLAFYREEMMKEPEADVQAGLAIVFCKIADHSTRLSRMDPGRAKPTQLFYNQQFNSFFNYGVRAFPYFQDILTEGYRRPKFISGTKYVGVDQAKGVKNTSDLFVTDPPYADAIHYHEITEFFIAWLRGRPPTAFSEWPWDSRRSLAIKGKDATFRRSMIEAYRAMADHMSPGGMQLVMFTHQDAAVWADLAMILWAAGLQVTAAWCVVTETEKFVTTGSFVQGTVVLVLRRRLTANNGWAEDVLVEVEDEVVAQIRGMHALDDAAGEGGTRHFTDADLQLAAYAAALRIVTGYATIEGKDVGAEVLRERRPGEKTEIQSFIERAVGIANNYLVPDGLSKATWDAMPRDARFYLKMVEVEAGGGKELSAYAEFGRAFGLDDHRRLLARGDANDARLKWAAEFRGQDLGEGDFGSTLVRHVLFGIYTVMREQNARKAVAYLQQEVPDYWKRRQTITEIARFLAARKARDKEAECAAAEVLAGAVAVDRIMA